MLKKLLKYISEQKLFQSDQKVLLAVSGGIDSIVMAHLFQQTKFQYAFVHCNFQLRGIESDEDQAFVEQLAVEFEVPCFTNSFDTTAFAKKHKISIQMAARELRRNWFEDLLKKENYDMVATGHHLNDSLETIIFNLAKGTGISGLKGITPKKDKYIRPLMFASRDMMVAYTKSHQISWHEDRSNSSTKYHRNLIRHKIIPELKKINPKLEESFSSSMAKIGAAERIYRQAIDKERKTLCDVSNDGIRIEKAKLKSNPESQQILFEIIEEFGFNYQQSSDILQALDGQSGKCFYSEKHQLVIDREYLFISPNSGDEISRVLINKKDKWIEAGTSRFKVECIKPDEVSFSDDNNMVFLDFDRLEFPMKLRKWKEGDRFQPLGMHQKKKLSDFMIDEKIPLNLKKQALVLISAENIVWVVGYRIDDRYKITKQTTNVYKICNIKQHDKSV